MTGVRSRAGYAWLLLGLSLACRDDPSTGVLVSIHADQLVSLDVDRLQVLIYASEERDERKPVEDRPFYVTNEDPETGEVTFPFSFLILRGEALRFRLVVKGYRAGSAEPVIEQKVVASFREGYTEVLRILLGDACHDMREPCLALDQTCYPLQSEAIEAGACGPVPLAATERVVAGSELDAAIRWRESGELDAEARSDAGAEDDAAMDDASAELDAGAERDAKVEREADVERDARVEQDAGSSVDDAGEGGRQAQDGAATDACLDGQISSACGPDPCAAQPCQHGGRCIAASGAYSCDCTATGFDGPTCATNVNECNGMNVCAGTRNGVAFAYPCSDNAGENIGYACPGMFSDWPPPNSSARFTESPAGVVQDGRTGLSWQRVIDALDRTFVDARSYCASLPLAGGGFRLPTRAELDTITDLTVREPSAIDQTIFPGTPGTWFWTSSPYVGMAGFHWVVNFYNGSFYYQGPTFAEARVRCVRRMEAR